MGDNLTLRLIREPVPIKSLMVKRINKPERMNKRKKIIFYQEIPSIDICLFVCLFTFYSLWSLYQMLSLEDQRCANWMF